MFETGTAKLEELATGVDGAAMILANDVVVFYWTAGVANDDVWFFAGLFYTMVVTFWETGGFWATEVLLWLS